MQQIITYSLKKECNTSDEYYQVIKKYAKETSLYINQVMEDILKAFSDFTQKEAYEIVRTKEEYGIEILMLGVLWISYKDEALGLSAILQKLLATLNVQREKGRLQKAISDFLKGKLATLALTKRNRMNKE